MIPTRLALAIIVIFTITNVSYSQSRMFTLPLRRELPISCGFYGYKFASGKWHGGTDFWTTDRSTGQEVIAALGGEVVKVVNDIPNDGSYIKIKHDDGSETIYDHLVGNSINVTIGTHVEKGELLGKKYRGGNIYAEFGGEVVEVVDDIDYIGYGNYVIIRHSDGYETFYAHLLKEVEVSEKDKVYRGQLLGKLGNTGDSSNPHLHFEVRKNNIPVDPYDLDYSSQFDPESICKGEYPPKVSMGENHLWTTDPPSHIVFDALSFHKEQEDPSGTVYQVRNESGEVRLWPIFHSKVLKALGGGEYPSMDTTHPLRSLRKNHLIGPILGQIGTLYRAPGDETIWIVTEVNTDELNPSLGRRRHLTNDAYQNGFMLRREEELLPNPNVLEVEQSLIDQYEQYSDGGLFTSDRLLGLIGKYSDGSTNAVLLETYNEHEDENGYNKLGYPIDNGGGIVIHKWGGFSEDEWREVWIQDFRQLNEPHFGTDGETALILNPQGDAAYLIRDDFWRWYKEHEGHRNLGPPLDQEPLPALPPGTGTSEQHFLYGWLEWTGDETNARDNQDGLIPSYNVTITNMIEGNAKPVGIAYPFAIDGASASGTEIWHNGTLLGITPVTINGYQQFTYGMVAKASGQPDVYFEFAVGSSDMTVQVPGNSSNTGGDPDPNAIAVWPGDTNNDGRVSIGDVLPLGLYWMATGPSRESQSCIWGEHLVSPWTPPAATYADANGSGNVELSDLFCIKENWGRTHTLSTKPVVAAQHPAGEVALSSNNSQECRAIVVQARDIGDLIGISFVIQASPENALKSIHVRAGELLDEEPLLFSHIDDKTGEIAIAVSQKAGQRMLDDSGTIAYIETENPSIEEHTLRISQAIGSDVHGNIFLLNVADKGLVAREDTELSQTVELDQNYPNPFNANTIIEYTLPEAAYVQLTVYSILGQPVRHLVTERHEVGNYQVEWDGKDTQGREVSTGGLMKIGVFEEVSPPSGTRVFVPLQGAQQSTIQIAC